MDLDVSARAEAKTFIDELIEAMLELETFIDHAVVDVNVEHVVIEKVFVPLLICREGMMVEDGKLSIEVGFGLTEVAVAIALKFV